MDGRHKGGVWRRARNGATAASGSLTLALWRSLLAAGITERGGRGEECRWDFAPFMCHTPHNGAARRACIKQVWDKFFFLAASDSNSAVQTATVVREAV